MSDELLDSLRAAWDSLDLDASLLVGFVSGWLLFEITERRRVRLGQRELRRALVAELESAEALVSSIIGKYARCCQGDEDVSFVAGEIRWFYKLGRKRMENVGILADLPSKPRMLDQLTDQQLVALMSSVKETIGNKVILPIVESALNGQTLGFSADQIQSLSMVRWQAHLLGQDAESMKELLQLSFTVEDETNHQIVVANHEQQTVAYAHRARTLLRAIRKALQLMQ